MKFKTHQIEYRDQKTLSSEIEFAVACDKVEGYELCNIFACSGESEARFIGAAIRILKGMKKDGVIKLFVKRSDLMAEDKMESVYLLNKFPELADTESGGESIYIKF